MESAQNTFISSTFWTERIGPTAGLATLKEMEKVKSWEIITAKGKTIKNNWRKLASNHNISIKITGMDALATFIIESDNWLKYKTYITQSMLEKNFLAANVVYTSTKHSNKILNEYFDSLDKVFRKIGDFERGVDSVDDHLISDVCQTEFKRLN